MITDTVIHAAATPLAPAHSTIGAGENIWLAWTFDPVAVIAISLIGWAYARGQRALPPRMSGRSGWHGVWFYAGLLAIFTALASPIDALSAHQFSVHMAQHLLLTTSSLLLTLGAPGIRVLAALPGKWRRRLLALTRVPLIAKSWSTLSHPAVALTASVASAAVWHLLPGWYDAAFAHDGLHYLEHLSFFGTGLLFWTSVVDPARWKRRLGHLVSIGYVLAHSVCEMAIGLAIVLADRPLYAAYSTARAVFPISALEDQQIGGVAMLVVGELIDLAVVAMLFGAWWSNLASSDTPYTPVGVHEVSHSSGGGDR